MTLGSGLRNHAGNFALVVFLFIHGTLTAMY